MSLPEFNLAQGLGYLAFFLGIYCFYQKDDRQLKVIMVVMNLNLALHFALLGAVTASFSALMAGVRALVALKTSSIWVAFIFIGVTLGWGAYLAEDWTDMIPVVGNCIGTFSVFCLRGIAMRCGFLLGACCWLTNNILVGSIGPTLLEATLIAVNCTTMWRLLRDRKTTQAQKSPAQGGAKGAE